MPAAACASTMHTCWNTSARTSPASRRSRITSSAASGITSSRAQLSARVILQYTLGTVESGDQCATSTKNFNADFLITYLMHPGTAIYVGYNSDLANLDRWPGVDPVTGCDSDHAQWVHQ